MKTTNGILVIAAGVTIVVNLVNPVLGASEQYTLSVPWTPTDFGLELSFPKFSPTVGTLTSVELDLTGTMKTQMTFDVTEGSVTVKALSTEVTMWVQDSANSLTVKGSPVSYDNPQFDLLETAKYGSGSGVTVNETNPLDTGLLQTSGTSSVTYTDWGILSQFIGTGNQTLMANAGADQTATTTNPSGNVQYQFNQVTDASLSGTVTYYYTYNAVPEAGTMFLGGCVVVPLMGYRRRVRRE